MKMTIIAATGLSKQLGLKGDIPWKLPEDLKNFKKITMGHHILMGRKTYESLGRPLPGRVNLVISSSLEEAEGFKVFRTIEEGVQFAKSSGESELFICGGSKIYEEALSFADFMYLTQVNYDGEADAYFPAFDIDAWEPIMKTTEHESISGHLWCLSGFQRKKEEV